MNDDYKFDVFISHRKVYPWRNWVHDHFEPLLKAHLALELGKDQPPVFIDYDCIPKGGTWPQFLAEGLARSRLLIPLCSRLYFNSDWCNKELALMMERERQCGFRTPSQPLGLVIPVIIHDGDRHQRAGLIGLLNAARERN